MPVTSPVRIVSAGCTNRWNPFLPYARMDGTPASNDGIHSPVAGNTRHHNRRERRFLALSPANLFPPSPGTSSGSHPPAATCAFAITPYADRTQNHNPYPGTRATQALRRRRPVQWVPPPPRLEATSRVHYAAYSKLRAPIQNCPENRIRSLRRIPVPAQAIRHYT